jgi:hypothetical protein
MTNFEQESNINNDPAQPVDENQPKEEGDPILHKAMLDYRDGRITVDEYQSIVADQIAKGEQE